MEETKQIDANKITDLGLWIEKKAWNDAIEEAAKVCEHSGYAEQIRKLKK